MIVDVFDSDELSVSAYPVVTVPAAAGDVYAVVAPDRVTIATCNIPPDVLAFHAWSPKRLPQHGPIFLPRGDGREAFFAVARDEGDGMRVVRVCSIDAAGAARTVTKQLAADFAPLVDLVTDRADWVWLRAMARVTSQRLRVAELMSDRVRGRASDADVEEAAFELRRVRAVALALGDAATTPHVATPARIV